MGSHHTLDQQGLAAEALELGPGDWRHSHAVAHLATEHPQVRTHQLDHRDWIYDHPTRRSSGPPRRPSTGSTASSASRRSAQPYGQRAVRDREAALALGVRVAVHNSRQNNPNPVIWQPGQDYRAADAIHAARTRTWVGPERLGPER